MTGKNEMNKRKLMLASRSPRRLELLSAIFPVNRIVVVESDIDETISPGEAVEDYCCRIAQEKAVTAWYRYQGTRSDIAVVVGADTVVVLGREIIGQPCDEDDAVRILKKLVGRRHDVITGVALLNPGSGAVNTFAVKSEVWMREIGLEAIREYVATGEPLDKAGAYAIQGEGKRLIARYEGSYSNIVGLPVHELQAALSRIFQ
jgi:septum formation protein